jgi:hypothetical protein
VNEAAERDAVRRSRPLNDTRDITLHDRWANVARALAYQPEKDTATALLDRLRQAKRGGVRAFQQVMPDVRQARHAAELPAQQVAQRRSIDRTLEQAREFIAHAVERVENRFIGRQEQAVSRHHDGPSLAP